MDLVLLLSVGAVGFCLSALVVLGDAWEARRRDERRQRALDSLRWPE